ncbi:MAG TPA: amidohydrolase family protein [Chloroflexota bacterium]|nr:amidohydrolase family protein [Chloroflexota bacterium]
MDYQMISVDDHIDMQYLPGDLWTTRLPAALRDRGPRVVETETGYAWTCEDKTWGGWAGGKPKGPPSQRYYKTALEKGGVYEPGVLRPTIAELRLADMTRDGIEASFMFGPISAFSCDDPALREAIYQAYNDWLIEFCANNPRRLHGMAALPGEDVPASIREMRRLAATGVVKQVNFLIGRAQGKIYQDEWEPFWEAVEETGMIVSFHVGGGFALGGPGRLREERAANVFGPSKGFITAFLDTFHGLLAEGVLDRHASVKLMLAEVGLGWLPWLVHEMDYRYQRLLDNRDYWSSRGGIHLTMPPSEIWKRNFWVTFQDDPVGLAQLKFCNEDHILWASDYPHPDSTFPDSRRIVEEQMADLTPVQRRKILRDNALALYGLKELAAVA